MGSYTRIAAFAVPRYILGVLVLAATCSAETVSHFKYWYPQGRELFETIVTHNCSSELNQYQTGNLTAATANQWNSTRVLTTDAVDVLRANVFACILSATPENIKANMAAVGVFLGIFPTLLAILGSSTTETATLALLAQRPFLAIALALGSPATNPIRPFDIPDMETVLRCADTSDSVPLIRFRSKLGQYLVSAVEYLAVAASIANLATLTAQLDLQTVTSFWAGGTSGAVIWAFTASVAHLWGMVCLRLRFRPTFSFLASDPAARAPRSWIDHLRREVTPSYTHPAPILVPIPDLKARLAFLAFSLLTAVGIVAHVAWGTVIFSSLSFILTDDAVIVAFRLLASTVICRTILAYELAGIRHVCHKKRQESPKELPG